MTTFAALRTQCATRFRDAGNNVVTDTVWKDYVNQAYQKVNNFTPLWPWLETSEQTVTVLSGTRGIALPSDVLQVNWVFNTTDNLKMIPMEGRGDQWRGGTLRTDTGTPQTYRLRAGNIEVFPLPTGNTVLVAECNLMPVRLSGDTDVPVFPASFHELLIPGALALAFADDGNHEWYTLHYAQFQEELTKMRDALLAFRTESYAPVRDTFWG